MFLEPLKTPDLADKISPPPNQQSDKIGDRRDRPDTSQPKRSKRRQPKHGGTGVVNPATAGKEEKEQSSTEKPGHNYHEIVGSLVASKFRLLRLLGSGSYGKCVAVL